MSPRINTNNKNQNIPSLIIFKFDLKIFIYIQRQSDILRLSALNTFSRTKRIRNESLHLFLSPHASPVIIYSLIDKVMPYWGGGFEVISKKFSGKLSFMNTGHGFQRYDLTERSLVFIFSSKHFSDRLKWILDKTYSWFNIGDCTELWNIIVVVESIF